MPGFQIRSFEDTVKAMVGWIQANPNFAQDFTDPAVQAQPLGTLFTDLTPGSLEMANLEALAMLMEDYDVRAQQAIAYALTNAAYNAFGFTPLPATRATGVVTLGAYEAPAAPIEIPAGFMVGTTEGVQYQTTQAATLAAGSKTVAAPVQAIKTGPTGNVAAGAIQRILHPIVGVDTVNNTIPTWGGKDQESEAARQARFTKWVNTLARGTSGALEYAATVIAPTCGTGVTILSAQAIEPSLLVPQIQVQGASWLPPDLTAAIPYAGLVWLFVDDGSQGQNPDWAKTSAAVLTAVNGGQDAQGNTVEPWKAAGILVQVLPVMYQPVDVSATIILTDAGHGRQAEVADNLLNAALNYFHSLDVGGAVNYGTLLAALATADQDVLSVSLMQIARMGQALGTGNLDLDPIADVGMRFTLNRNSPMPTWSFR